MQILKIMCQILEGSRDRVSPQLGESLASFACREMVAQKEIKNDWQQQASDMLVLLVVPFPEPVIKELLAVFQPGVIPHYFVLKTLADVAPANSVGVTLRMQELLSRLIPCLGGVKTEPVMWVITTSKLLSSRREFILTGLSQSWDDLLTLSITFLLMPPRSKRGTCEPTPLKPIWPAPLTLSSRNGSSPKIPRYCSSPCRLAARVSHGFPCQVRFAVVEALGFISFRLSKDTYESNIQKLVPTYLGMYKKEKYADFLPISQGLCAALEAGVEMKSLQLEMLLPSILQTIHPLVCRQPDYSSPSTVKNHNEMLRCIEILGREYLDQVLNFVTSRFSIKENTSIEGSLVILRHMVNSMGRF